MKNLPFLICEAIKERTLGGTRKPMKFTYHTDDDKDIEMENIEATFERFIDKNNKMLLSNLLKAYELSKCMKKSRSKISRTLPIYTVFTQLSKLKSLTKDLKSSFITDHANIPGNSHIMVINGYEMDANGKIKELRINIIPDDDEISEKEMMLKIDEFKKIVNCVATIIN